MLHFGFELTADKEARGKLDSLETLLCSSAY